MEHFPLEMQSEVQNWRARMKQIQKKILYALYMDFIVD